MDQIQTDAFSNLNDESAKRSKWIGRIENVHLQAYEFYAKGKKVQAKKMVCCIIGVEPTDYAQGVVPFDFRNPTRPQNAFATWKQNEGRVYQITKPLLDKRTARKYISFL